MPRRVLTFASNEMKQWAGGRTDILKYPPFLELYVPDIIFDMINNYEHSDYMPCRRLSGSELNEDT